MEESPSFPGSAKAARGKPNAENWSERVMCVTLRQMKLNVHHDVSRLIHSTNVKTGAM